FVHVKYMNPQNQISMFKVGNSERISASVPLVPPRAFLFWRRGTLGLRMFNPAPSHPRARLRVVAAGILPAVEPRLPARRRIMSPALRLWNFPGRSLP